MIEQKPSIAILSLNLIRHPYIAVAGHLANDLRCQTVIIISTVVQRNVIVIMCEFVFQKKHLLLQSMKVIMVVDAL